VLVLIAGIVLIFMPIRLLLKNFKEIITMFASDEIQYDVYNIVKKMNVKFNINEEDLRISKMGQVIYIDLQKIVSESLQVKTIDEADEYRNELIEKLNRNFKNFDKWLNVSLTQRYYSNQIN